MSLEERIAKIKSGPEPANEEAAKFQVIAPILGELGWDTADGSEVLLEHQVGGRGKQGGRVDIALQANVDGRSRIVAMIEAKAPNADLRQHVTQVLGYAFHEGADICVLTTGLEWWLFLPREPGPPMKRRFASLNLKNDSVERVAEDLSAFLHKEELAKSNAQEKANSVLRALLEADHLADELPKIWNQMLTEPDEGLVTLVAARAYERLNLRPEQDQIIAVLRDKPVSPVGDVRPRPEPPRHVPKHGQKPTAIVLWGVRHPVSAHKQILHVVADQLYERHSFEFDKLLQLKGRKYPHVALDPARLASYGSQPAYYHVKLSRYYIGDHGSAEAVLRRAERFLECFGYDKTDLEVLFE